MIRSVRRGHAPNCSAAGAVVGAALVSAALCAAVVNAFADRFVVWRSAPRPPPPGTAPPGSPEPPQPRARREASGGLLAWPEPAAVLELDAEGFDDAVAAGAIEVGGRPAPAGGWSAPIEVHLQLTDRCPARCDTCYLDAGPDRAGPDPDLDDVVDGLAALGVFEIALGGGEALLRDDVVALAQRIRAAGMVPNLTTSGFALTPALAARLATVMGQVNVSLDGLDDDYAAVRGWDGAALGLRTIRTLRDAGIRVGVNTVLTRANLDGLEGMAGRLAALGVAEWQWLRLKPAGRGAAGFAGATPTADQYRSLWPRALAIEASTDLTIRWDCAMVPFLAEHEVPVAHLAALGVRGCPGGEALLSRGADGRWSPCSFAREDAIAVDDPGEAWDRAPALTAWRALAAAPPEPCRSCAWQPVCRGGCRVVARHVVGDALAPDPECPKVRACG